MWNKNDYDYGLLGSQLVTFKFTWIDNISDAEKEKVLDNIDRRNDDEFLRTISKLLPNCQWDYHDTTDDFNLTFWVDIKARDEGNENIGPNLIYDDFNRVEDSLIKEVKLELLNLLKKYNITEITDMSFSAEELTDADFHWTTYRW